MKYYFPTSTLNFDNILSSQMLAPSAFYAPGTLWWNRFETIAGTASDTLILYSKCPSWEMEAGDRDHYPLVLEIDLDLHREECESAGCSLDTVEPGLEAVALSRPLFFTFSDFIKGRIRFLFRSEQEMQLVKSKTEVGVAECKVIQPLLDEDCGTFAVIDPGLSRFDLKSVLPAVALSLNAPLSGRDPFSADAFQTRERMRGAELGYRLGRYIKSLRSGSFLDGFRFGGPLSFSEWRAGYLPEPFQRILTMQLHKGLSRWDPNRQAVAELCHTCWDEAFAKSGVEKGTPLHHTLQNIARHWVDADSSYEVEEEKDPFMQAFSVFLECGNDEKRYLSFLKDPRIALPELILALYGATVGYTSFSRGLMENGCYVSGPVRSPDLPASKKTTTLPEKERKPEGAGEGEKKSGEEPDRRAKSGPKHTRERYWETEAGVEPAKTAAKPAGKTRKTSAKTSAKKRSSPKIGKTSAAVHPQENLPGLDFSQEKEGDRSLLVFDPDLQNAIRKTFFKLKDFQQLASVVAQFSKMYRPDGEFGRDPEQFQLSNDKLIKHLLSCTTSENTPHLNFNWLDDTSKRQFEAFLRARYF